jgi:hypothetical protein
VVVVAQPSGAVIENIDNISWVFYLDLNEASGTLEVEKAQAIVAA